MLRNTSRFQFMYQNHTKWLRKSHMKSRFQ
uniref:Uncharacterized protein n=1 Tax=Megaselia scalaris TaxID=36166 RepID=T1GS69_MEGSC